VSRYLTVSRPEPECPSLGLQVIVDAKTKDVEALIRDIGERQAIADRQQADAQAKQKELSTNAVIIAEESEKASRALEAAIPALEAAAMALENLNKDDIQELKSFASPPPLVMMVRACSYCRRGGRGRFA
jgi:dynein heavy chain, axonemal